MFIAIAWMKLTPQLEGPCLHPWRLKQTDTRAKSGSCSMEHPFVQSRQKPGYEEGRGGGGNPWQTVPGVAFAPTEKALPAMYTHVCVPIYRCSRVPVYPCVPIAEKT